MQQITGWSVVSTIFARKNGITYISIFLHFMLCYYSVRNCIMIVGNGNERCEIFIYTHLTLWKFYNKLISHTYVPHSMLKGHIRPTVKKTALEINWFENYRPVMNSSNFLEVIEYLLLSLLEKHLLIHENQFAYRPATGCIDAITVLKHWEK